MTINSRQKQTTLAINLGLACNTLLAFFKTFVGIIGHSQALLADGINSTSDVVYYIIAKIYTNLADQPADKEHPYGHQQLEHISSLIIGAFILTTAVAIFWNSINTVFDLLRTTNISESASYLALTTALITIILKIILNIISLKIAKTTNNPTVYAIAYDHRNDIFSASAASIGIFFSILGYLWVDPLAGALVALIIFKTGIKILQDSANELMTGTPGKKTQSIIKKVVLKTKGVKAIEELLIHKYGPYMVINLTINIDGTLTVTQGNKISNTVEKSLYKNFNFIRKVHVHFHPPKKQVH
ncbi:MAG: hypothetical protein UR27_C0007G0095 [Candidatus Peregrinibacteria bacterium GW2011_GWA2_33_10]|nr:MAG: hypothetical protein UR27_C0007G0095 [Candidatus Peregrinibacteria bacterium GW2011_GWA2_33_10]KKP40844.1 MAG: cation diffusion facilitator family transporter [Candidatus Peregrinibacteria bacterium GW2011_GWC2_33_13]OGJ50642.1 MAG: hypothetical protein A2229_04605 [Candidatus Peregrinibacteria bacterium RIFOXYA2_FULL_33_7]